MADLIRLLHVKYLRTGKVTHHEDFKSFAELYVTDAGTPAVNGKYKLMKD